MAQTREVDATMQVLEQATDRGMSWKGPGYLRHHNYCVQYCKFSLLYSYAGLDFKEVAHDMNISLTKRIAEKGYVNSYDTWHGRCMYIATAHVMHACNVPWIHI